MPKRLLSPKGSSLALLRIVVSILLVVALGVFLGRSASSQHDVGFALATQGVAQVTVTAESSPTSTGLVTTPDTISSGPVVLTAPERRPIPEGSGPQVLTMTGSALGPVTLDPALIRDAEGAFLARQVFRGLVTLTDDLEIVPELASKIEISADRLVYTFHLRDNAVFHDGTPITSASVVASLNRAADPALTDGHGESLPAAMYLIDIEGTAERLAGESDTISGVRAIDQSTLEIRLRAPTVTFLYKLAGSCSLIVDVDSIDSQEWWSEPNGSGPFVLEELNSGMIVLRGFDNFYSGAPGLDEVRILQGSAVAQPLNLYERGQIDLTETPFYSLDRVLWPSDPLHDDLVIVQQLSSTYLLINPNHPPFDDINVRKAIAHAIDRDKFVRIGMDDKVLAASGIVPPGILGRDWPAESFDYDLDAARAFLDAAGELELSPTIYGGLAATIKLAVERDLGLNIDVIVAEWPLFSSKLTSRSMPAFVLSWIADYPDPSNFIDSMFHSGSPDNYIGYSNPDVDNLLDQAAVEADEAARTTLYLEAQQIVVDDAVLIPLYHDVSHMLVKSHVQGLVVSPAGILSLEHVWIER
jgi:oligopeptide transport system substrate-binding protein